MVEQPVMPMGVAMDEQTLAAEARVREAEMRAERAEAELRQLDAAAAAAPPRAACSQYAFDCYGEPTEMDDEWWRHEMRSAANV